MSSLAALLRAGRNAVESSRIPTVNDLLLLGRTELEQLVSLNASLSTTPGKRKKKKIPTAVDTSNAEELCTLVRLRPDQVAMLLQNDYEYEEEEDIFQDISIDILGIEDLMPALTIQEAEPVRIPIPFEEVDSSEVSDSPDEKTVNDAMSFVSGMMNRKSTGENANRSVRQKTRL